MFELSHLAGRGVLTGADTELTATGNCKPTVAMRRRPRRPASSFFTFTIACGLLATMLGTVRPALASLQIAIGNPGLGHFDSDGGVQLDFGLTDQGGQPVGNLTKDNVQVFEDGKLAKVVYFRGVGQGRPVDIVFVLDLTESMQPYIDAVKQNMINFAQ